MKRILSLFFIFLVAGSLVVQAQVTEDQMPKKVEVAKSHWLISLGGGVANQTALPNYSVTSPNLSNGAANNRSPYLFWKVGYRFQNKHQAAFILEKTVATNSFLYTGDYSEGLGANREIDCIIANLEYSYNLFNTKRFWFGPSVQLGVGLGTQNSTAFFDRGREANFNTPVGRSFHKYDVVEHSIPSHIYNFGIGTNFGIKVPNSHFIIGTDIRWLYSFSPVHEYKIKYQYNAQILDFTVNSPLSNINLGIKLAYLF